ncbi:MAG: hypothetical protein M1820_003608 [Bogoriella megaspora]|nr:MAG: hypothetical protein M1820_003608 [Bogoriella megaspora]
MSLPETAMVSEAQMPSPYDMGDHREKTDSHNTAPPIAPLLSDVLDGLPNLTTESEGGKTETSIDPKSTANKETSSCIPDKVRYMGDDFGSTVKNLYEGPQKCRCCFNWVEEYPDDLKSSISETEESKSHALVVRHRICHDKGRTKPLEIHSIKVQSTLLKEALCNILKGYPSVTADLDDLEFESPFKPLFHRRIFFNQELDKAESQGGRLLSELKLLHNIIEEDLSDVLRVQRDFTKHHVISFTYLWTLFPPGSKVFERLDGPGVRYKAAEVVRTGNYDGLSKYFFIEARYIDWDGANFGYVEERIRIYPFEGTIAIKNLKAIPFEHHEFEADEIERLVARGCKVDQLTSGGHKAYDGLARTADSRPYMETGDIMIDAKAYFREMPSEADDMQPLVVDKLGLAEKDRSNPSETRDCLSREQALLCNPVVRGFCLKSKTWAVFDVDNVEEIGWSYQPLRNLAIPETRKKLLLAIADQQRPQTDRFDDVIQGKGQGLVMLFTGTPGTGKTLTAESLTNHLRLPLYSLTAGNLGEDVETIEHRLTKAFDLAAHWNAVLLLDEADVFMEERSSSDLSRNRLVAVFLRMLEYYKGTLILTTNRAIAIDPAFHSRIHLTLHYAELDASAKKKIWKNFIDMTQLVADEAELEVFSKVSLNGRQIKNTVKMAQLLARSNSEVLQAKHVTEVIEVMETESAAVLGGGG